MNRGRTRASWLLSLAVLASATSANGEPTNVDDSTGSRLTIERLYSLPHLIGTAPRDFAWSPDGRYLAFLWNDQGFNFRDVWMVDTEDPGLSPVRVTRMLQDKDGDAPDGDDSVAAAKAEERRERDPGVISVIWHPDGQQLLASFRGDLWLAAKGSEPKRLLETAAPEQRPAYSPDGNTLAFLRDGELWSPGLQRTQVSGPGVQIEDFTWSPDGTKIAILETDQRQVKLRGIPDYLADETELVEVRRAYPGEEPTGQRIGIIDAKAVETGADQVRWIDWDEDPPDMILSYRWSPDGKYLAVDTSDLYAKDRRVFVIDLQGDASLVPRLVARDQDPLNETFYFWHIEWSHESQRLYFLSDRDEDYHVYAVGPTGQDEPVSLTNGAWAVAGMYPVDGGLIVVGNRGQAEERHLFRVDDNGGEPVQISQRPGTHSPAVSPDGRYAAVHFSSQGMPPELFLTSLEVTAGGRAGAGARPYSESAAERRVTHSPVDEFDTYRWVESQFVTFKSHIDGSTLHGRLTLPPGFDPEKSYPAILGSVYTDSVRNQWGGRTAHPTWGLDQYLAQEGTILLNVDMRGSWGRGREHRRGIRLDYGGMDIEDLESGVRYLGALGYVDMDHVGIWGSSYGGLMTAMSLFRKPGLYAAGIAGAPATNVWHALSGQMAVMMRPQDRPEEYADSSPFMHAHGLEDPLMIIHGMRDRVVLFKDSVILVQRLILLGKDVELVTLPNAGHGWDNEGLAQTRFAFNKMVQFFDRHLKEPCMKCKETNHEVD